MERVSKANHLTPFALAKAIMWPFIWIPGGWFLLLGLVALVAGIDPRQFAADFVTDSAVALSPLALKCALAWAFYSAIYLLWIWPYCSSLNPFGEFAESHPALCTFIRNWTVRFTGEGISVASSWLLLFHRRSFWRSLGLSWSPGVHPQME